MHIIAKSKTKLLKKKSKTQSTLTKIKKDIQEFGRKIELIYSFRTELILSYQYSINMSMEYYQRRKRLKK